MAISTDSTLELTDVLLDDGVSRFKLELALIGASHFRVEASVESLDDALFTVLESTDTLGLSVQDRDGLVGAAFREMVRYVGEDEIGMSVTWVHWVEPDLQAWLGKRADAATTRRVVTAVAAHVDVTAPPLASRRWTESLLE
ncbi:MAG TPA: hypothetical protein VF624_11005 [Tepidisphaeraceae bacterium]